MDRCDHQREEHDGWGAWCTSIRLQRRVTPKYARSMTMRKPSGFFTGKGGEGTWYEYAQREHNRDVQRMCDEMFTASQGTVGGLRNLLNDAPLELNARCWELYVTFVLLNQGRRLAKPGKSSSPDVCVIGLGGEKTWIECVSVKEGNNADAAVRVLAQYWECAHGSSGLYRPAFEKIILRLVENGLQAKIGKYAGYREKGGVDEEDGFVIAVNAGEIRDADLLEHGLPSIVEAVYGGVRQRGKGSFSHGVRPFVRARIGQPDERQVATTGFIDGSMPDVSAVIFSPYAIQNISLVREIHPGDEGRDLVLVHNQRARRPLPRGWLGCGREYSVDGEFIMELNYRNPEPARARSGSEGEEAGGDEETNPR